MLVALLFPYWKGEKMKKIVENVKKWKQIKEEYENKDMVGLSCILEYLKMARR